MSDRVSLDLTHVLYDASSTTSIVLALLTLSPILLMPAYAALAVQTRELTIINMWAGQLLSEALNLVLKHIVKEERPNGSNLHLNGYGFPSSHSQYMGYFGAFLVCHMFFRHRFASCGYTLLDQAFRSTVYLGIVLWVVLVAYSRLHLLYHTTHQVIWGLGIGVGLGVVHYVLTELLPRTRPHSVFGRGRAAILAHPVVIWMQIRDGWSIWADGGRENEWKCWKAAYDEQHTRIAQKRVH